MKLPEGYELVDMPVDENVQVATEQQAFTNGTNLPEGYELVDMPSESPTDFSTLGKNLDFSQLSRTIEPDAKQESSNKILPTIEEQGLGIPVVSPEIVIGGAAKGVGFIAGEIFGSIGADTGIEIIEDILTEEFKKENPKLAAFINLSAALIGGYLGGKVEPETLDYSSFGKEWNSANKKIKDLELEGEIPDISDIDARNKAYISNAIDEAEKAGIDLFASDIDTDTAMAQLQKSMMKNPVTAGQIADTTKEQKVKLLDYMKKVKETISEEFSSVEDIMELTKEKLNAKDIVLAKEASKAYDALRELGSRVKPIETGMYYGSLNNLKLTALNGKYSNDPEVIQGIESFIGKKLDIINRSGKGGSFEDLYGFMDSVITKSAELSKVPGKGSESTAYARLGSDLEVIYDDLIKQSGNSSEIKDILTQGKEIYKRRLKFFGYRKTGKGSESFIPKFMETINTQPVKAVDMIKSKNDWLDLVEHLDENSLGLIRRAKIESIISKAEINNELSLDKFANLLSKENPRLMTEIFGKDTYKTLNGLAKVSKYIGTRTKLLENANILGIEGLKGKLASATNISKFFPMIQLLTYVAQQKIGSSLLIKKNQAMLLKIKRDINESLKSSGTNIDELILNATTLMDDAKYGIKINKRETFNPPKIKSMPEATEPSKWTSPKSVELRKKTIEAATKKKNQVNGIDIRLRKQKQSMDNLLEARAKLLDKGKNIDKIDEKIDIKNIEIAKTQQDYNIANRELSKLNVEVETIRELRPASPTTAEPRATIKEGN